MEGISLAEAQKEVVELERERNPFQFAILIGLNRMGKPIYSGTVPEAEKIRRRKANKVARASRKKNR